MKSKFFLFFLSCTLVHAAYAQLLSKDLKKQTIDTLSLTLSERYAYKDIAGPLAVLLKSNINKGKYDELNHEEFAKSITSDLRSLNHDKHLALTYDPLPVVAAGKVSTPNPETAEQRAKRVSEFNRQMNFGFEKVQFFPGNIGYIKFNYFDAFLDYSGPVIDASFNFLKNADAIIIDLRDNTGGASATVNYISGLFFDTTTLIGQSYNRYTDSISLEYIQPREKESRLSQAAIYVLTGKATISGGEALAYVLKYLKNATVIGERSAGAANPGRVVRINSLFTAFIPNRYSTNIVSKTNWEGNGVPVDIQVPASIAVVRARMEALTRLKNESTDPASIKKYTTYLNFMNSKSQSLYINKEKAKEYTGNYENERNVIYEGGKLYYSGLAEAGGELVPVTKDVFMTAEGDITITFKRNEANKVTSLSSLWTLAGKPSFFNKIDP